MRIKSSIYDDGFEIINVKPVSSHLHAGGAGDVVSKASDTVNKGSDVANKVVDQVTSHITDIDPVSWVADGITALMAGVGAIANFIGNKKTAVAKAEGKKIDTTTALIEKAEDKKIAAKTAAGTEALTEEQAIAAASQKKTTIVVGILAFTLITAGLVTYFNVESDKK